MNVIQSDYYRIYVKTYASIHLHVYKSNFDPNQPFMNQHLEDKKYCANTLQDVFTRFQSNTTYILVVTTAIENKTTEFRIVVSGPKNITLKRISEYIFTNFRQ